MGCRLFPSWPCGYILLDSVDYQSLSADEDIEGGQFFYEAVDLASCIKYLDQVADPDDWMSSMTYVRLSS
jgi:hypothetical protein